MRSPVWLQTSPSIVFLLGPFAQVQSRELMEGRVTGGGSQDALSYPSNS